MGGAWLTYAAAHLVGGVRPDTITAAVGQFIAAGFASGTPDAAPTEAAT